MVIFNSYVSLPEGKPYEIPVVFHRKGGRHRQRWELSGALSRCDASEAAHDSQHHAEGDMIRDRKDGNWKDTRPGNDCDIAIEAMAIGLCGFTHWKWWWSFHSFVYVYQRVSPKSEIVITQLLRL